MKTFTEWLEVQDNDDLITLKFRENHIKDRHISLTYTLNVFARYDELYVKIINFEDT